MELHPYLREIRGIEGFMDAIRTPEGRKAHHEETDTPMRLELDKDWKIKEAHDAMLRHDTRKAEKIARRTLQEKPTDWAATFFYAGAVMFKEPAEAIPHLERARGLTSDEYLKAKTAKILGDAHLISADRESLGLENKMRCYQRSNNVFKGVPINRLSIRDGLSMMTNWMAAFYESYLLIVPTPEMIVTMFSRGLIGSETRDPLMGFSLSVMTSLEMASRAYWFARFGASIASQLELGEYAQRFKRMEYHLTPILPVLERLAAEFETRPREDHSQN